MLKANYNEGMIECGCDEAGRGCLAGPVFAAAVILPKNFHSDTLNDSKQLTAHQRYRLREEIEREAVAWAVASVDSQHIDKMNILRASIHAMNQAVISLTTKPQFLLIDGNRFHNETGIGFACIVKGDGLYMPIAAASILAKTYRDDYMAKIDAEYPGYGWAKNKGYPTADHYHAIERLGITPYHRKSFKLKKDPELDLSL